MGPLEMYEKLYMYMIQLKKLNGQTVFVNPDVIRIVEATPDSLITFTDGNQLMVKESPNEICEKIVTYRKTYFLVPEIRSS